MGRIRGSFGAVKNGAALGVSGAARVVLMILIVPQSVLHFFTCRWYGRFLTGFFLNFWLILRFHVYNYDSLNESVYYMTHNPAGILNGNPWQTFVISAGVLGLIFAFLTHLLSAKIIEPLYWSMKSGLQKSKKKAAHYSAYLDYDAQQILHGSDENILKADRDDFKKKMDKMDR